MKLRNLSAIAGLACGLAGIGVACLCRNRKVDLAGKVVLITGGARGLGFSLAREFALRGAQLALTSRHIEELVRAKVRLSREFRLEDREIFICASDVASVESVEKLVQAAADHFGRIDILVNNAGVILVGPVENFQLSHFEEAMNINFFGAVHCSLALLPQMMAQGGGSIVNIASIGGKVAFPHLLPYTASKFALVGWSQGLRTELACHGIQVTTVCPGVMRTGSHIQAEFTGDVEKEYKWFATAATLPLSAVSAEHAARKIVRATINNSAECEIGFQAAAASRLANLSPELTAALLSTANSFLPNARFPYFKRQRSENSTTTKGREFRHSLPRLMEHYGEKAIHEFNQDGQS